MADRNNLSPQASELLEAVRQMKAGDKARVYSPEQILAIAARQATKLTQTEFAQLLDVSVDAIRDWNKAADRREVPLELCCGSPCRIRKYWNN